MELSKPKPFDLHPPQRVITSNPRVMVYPGIFLRDVPLVNYEPKHQNRFILTFPPELNISPYLVYETSRPSYSINRDDQPWIPHHGPIRYDWDNIRIRLRDPIGPSVTRAMVESMMNTDLLQNPLEYKLELLGPVADVVERWIITGYITSVIFGDLSYDRDELADVEIVIRPSACHLEF